MFKHLHASAVWFVVHVSKDGMVRREMIVETNLRPSALAPRANQSSTNDLIVAVSKYLNEQALVHAAKIVPMGISDSAAVLLGRRGGRARAKKLPASRRKEIARTAAEARWLDRWADD